MKEDYIGFFDSGIGGISVLKETMKLLPNENYIYYGDSLNNPYGSKTKEQLYEITSNIVDFLINKGCKIIVVACNTATTGCIKYLREKYKNYIFIGTEPAIKVAYDLNYNNTLIMATPYTLKTERVHDLITKYTRKEQNILLLSCDNLANTIETKSKEEIRLCLNNLLYQYKDCNIDSIVLGCTHYSLIKEEIQNIMKDAVLLDGCLGIAKEIKRQLEIHGLLTDKTTKGKVEIYNSKDDKYIEKCREILEEKS